MSNEHGPTAPFPPEPPLDPLATRIEPQQECGCGGRYKILREHAKGGLGEVFVAYDRELDREVALKQIQGCQADNLQSRWRFLMEAKITGGLEHPGIVPVYGLGAYEDGRPYYAMRFIRGDSLEDAILRFYDSQHDSSETAERALEFRRLLGRFVDVCNAVEYAHSRGIIHRDLKPGNVMLGPYGETLVVDWGLAKSIDSAVEDRLDVQPPIKPTTGGGLAPTQMGIALGTPQFMSPEQALGRIDLLGPASDVYSLGATLYCLLTGCVPFNDHTEQLQAKIEQGKFKPPRQVNKRVSLALNAICLKAMANRPADRYPSARALADDIERWLADDPVAAHPDTFARRAARWMRRHRAVTLAAAASLLIITIMAMAAVGLIDRQRRLAEKHRATAESLAVEKNRLAESEHHLLEQSRWYATELGLQEGLADCQQDYIPRGVLALARSLPDVKEPDIRGLARSIRWQLAGWGPSLHHLTAYFTCRAAISSLTFSPENRDLIVITPQGATLQALDGSIDSKNLPIDNGARNVAAEHVLAIGPYGRVIVAQAPSGELRLRDSVSSEAVSKPLGAMSSPPTVVYSSDGLEIALAGFFHSIRGPKVEVRAFSTISGESLGVIGLDTLPRAIALSRDGATLFTATDAGNNASTLRRWDVTSGRAIGAGLTTSAQVSRVTLSADGKTLAAGNQLTTWLWTIDGESLTQERHVEGRSATFSPSGDIVLTLSGVSALLFQAETGKSLGRPLSHDAEVLTAAFSQDGRYVATGGRDRTARLWNPQTHTRLGAVIPHESPVLAVSFSHTGKELATGTVIGDARVWSINDAEPNLFAAAGPVRYVALNEMTHEIVANNERWSTAANNAPAKTLTTIAQLSTGDIVAGDTNGEWIVIAANSEAQVWNTASGKTTGKFLRFDGEILAADISDDGQTVVLGGQSPSGGEARAYNVATGAQIGEPIIRLAPIQTVALSDDGTKFLIAYGRTAELLMTVASREGAGPPLEHADNILSAAFSHDGQLVATGCEDNRTQIWNVSTGVARGAPLEHGEDILAIAFSPSGSLLITGSADRSAQIWEVDSGKPIGPPLRHPAEVRAVSFSGNGGSILTGCDDGRARQWPAPSIDVDLADVTLWVQDVTGLRLDVRGSVQPLTPADWLAVHERLKAHERDAQSPAISPPVSEPSSTDDL